MEKGTIMYLDSTQKQEIVKKYGKTSNDTGSSEVQIALLTAKISELSSHFGVHKKDNHSRVGLLKMVGKRRKLLEYLRERNLDKYKQLIEELNIRK